jgi:hypothetical protein
VWPFPGDFLETSLNVSDDKLATDFTLIDDYIKHYKCFAKESDSVLRLGTKAVINRLDENDKEGAFCFEDLSSGSVQLPVESNSFDNVIVLSGVEGLMNPKEYYREIWRVLKPGGRSFTFFSSKPLFLSEGTDVIKMWETMTDEQKIWIAGSYFHYSALGGWENIEGWDVTGSTGKEMLAFNVTSTEGEVSRLAYAVQSTKIEFKTMEQSTEDVDALGLYFRNQMLSLKNMVGDDRKFTSIRLASRYFKNDKYVAGKPAPPLDKLEQLYEIIKGVKEIVIPSPVKAMLACMLIDEWDNTPVQREALSMALGQVPPSQDFWLPIAKASMKMPSKEKIFFTVDLVAKYGKAEYADKMRGIPSLLNEALEAVTARFPAIDIAKQQSFVTDLVISDYLNNPKQTQENILKFVKTYPLKALAKMIDPPAPK